MKPPIRVLHVFGILNCGGAETMIMNLYRNIDRSQIQFDFVVHAEESGFYSNEIQSLGGTIYHCPHYTGVNHFRYQRWWRDFFKNHKEYKIVHSHVRSTAVVIFDEAKKYGIKTIAHSHSTSNGTGLSAIVKSVMQIPIRWKASYFFGCSKEASKWLFGEKVVNGDRFHTLQNAIDVEQFSFKPEIREKYRKEFMVTEKKVFIHVGSFRDAKNHLFLISLFRELVNIDCNSVLFLVGDGELKDIINKYVSDNNLEDYVLFLGLRTDIPELLMASDCFLFPSKWEGLPVSVVEAQASGIPVLVSNRITNDVALTGLIRYLPIDEGYEPWIRAVDEINTHTRTNTDIIIRNLGFDVKSTSKWLENFYKQVAS